MCLSCGCCLLSGRGLYDKPDHSSKGFLPTVVRRCVSSGNLVNEEVLAHRGPLRQKKECLYSVGSSPVKGTKTMTGL